MTINIAVRLLEVEPTVESTEQIIQRAKETVEVAT